MHQRAFLSGGWTRGGSSEVVRRAHPASGAQWNVQVVRGKVNGKCLWNACKALSLGLLLMVLGAAMATIGYYADDLSTGQEIRDNKIVNVKNESRGFHLNNLSYAGPIVMGVGGFIVVAACVMTFEARDSAAKVVPARLKMNSGPVPIYNRGVPNMHGSLRTSISQSGSNQHQHHSQHCGRANAERRALTQSFMQFSRGLALEHNKNMLKIPQGSINKSPSAPDLALEHVSSPDQSSPTACRNTANPTSSRKTFAACALLNPSLLHRHALSVDEASAAYKLSNESLHAGSQGSMAMDLHLDYPVTLRIRDRRRNPLKRQRKVEEDEKAVGDDSRRSSHSCSPRIAHLKDGNGSAHHLNSRRRSSNASDCTHRSRTRKRDCCHVRGKLERAISSDSRLTGGSRCHHHHPPTMQNSTESGTVSVLPGTSSSDSDVRRTAHHAVVHFSPHVS